MKRAILALIGCVWIHRLLLICEFELRETEEVETRHTADSWADSLHTLQAYEPLIGKEAAI